MNNSNVTLEYSSYFMYIHVCMVEELFYMCVCVRVFYVQTSWSFLYLQNVNAFYFNLCILLYVLNYLQKMYYL